MVFSLVLLSLVINKSTSDSFLGLPLLTNACMRFYLILSFSSSSSYRIVLVSLSRAKSISILSHKVGTVPTDKMHPVGTVPTNKMHPVGTVPTDKMHPVGTLKFKTG